MSACDCVTYIQVSVKRGVTYTRCVSGQTSTSGLPCEAGVIAYDSVDGASIQDRVRVERSGGENRNSSPTNQSMGFIKISFSSPAAKQNSPHLDPNTGAHVSPGRLPGHRLCRQPHC